MALYSILGISLPTQLVVNGDFSNGNSGWSGSGSIELAPTQVIAVQGSESLLTLMEILFMLMHSMEQSSLL